MKNGCFLGVRWGTKIPHQGNETTTTENIFTTKAIPDMVRSMTLKDDKVKEIQYLRGKGYNVREIAKRCGVSVKTAWKYSRDVIPERDYLELKLKDMKDTMAEMRGLITLMIAEREKCQKAQSDLASVISGCESAVKSIQNAKGILQNAEIGAVWSVKKEKDRAISEIRQQKDAVLGNLVSEIEKIKPLMAGIEKIKSIIDTLMSARDGIDAKYREICEFRDRLRDLLIALASFRDEVDKERWLAYFNKCMDAMLKRK
jgi:DNA repair exonuclease SbcCD ATPase subunit